MATLTKLKRKSDDAKEVYDATCVGALKSGEAYENHIEAYHAYCDTYATYTLELKRVEELKKKVDAAKALYCAAHEKVIGLADTTSYPVIKVVMDISYEAYLVYMDALNIYTHAIEI